ncbi:hypothetical protein M408DRAFT_326335 [Serendipita vermifera MAFF 305830]|uniref:Uncharacterized protein n=1 Tax=Serendipita vermifera MAFF 305830 TaxID=933852 RepID=A0A0C2X6J0_SERVB|nr:hypothetical protein M408DRAFT_326335 [Serendipita vermifera MAFF 305830]
MRVHNKSYHWLILRPPLHWIRPALHLWSKHIDIDHPPRSYIPFHQSRAPIRSEPQ